LSDKVILLYFAIFIKACGIKNCLVLKDKPGKVEATYFTVMCAVRLLAKTVAVTLPLLCIAEQYSLHAQYIFKCKIRVPLIHNHVLKQA